MASSSGEEMPPYSYSPLDQAGEGDIRLLRLWPGLVDEEEIRLDIFQVPRSSKPKYEALSCAWGSPAHTDIASVYDSVGIEEPKLKHQRDLAGFRDSFELSSALGIANNLAIALRHLRHPERGRVLWVDAICINQADDAEKSREVLQMEYIYRNAQEVIVWLGTEEDDSALALETLRRIGQHVEFNPSIREVTSVNGSWPAQLEDDKRALKEELPSWVSIGKLLRRRWFTRLWVFQEISSAIVATIVVGKRCLDWELFRLGVIWIWSVIYDINELVDEVIFEDFAANCMLGFLEVSYRNQKTSLTLMDALYFTKPSACFDNRDRLFGIRGLLTAEDRLLISPDYASTTEEVYKATTVSHMRHYDRLDILNFCVLRSPHPILSMPSWVPDFGFLGAQVVFDYGNADGFIRGVYSFDGGGFLALQGIRISEVERFWDSTLTLKSTDTETVNISQAWAKEIIPSAPYIAGGSIEVAFIGAIMGGYTRELGLTDFSWYPSTNDCKSIIFATIYRNEDDVSDSHNTSGRSRINNSLRRALSGRALFRTVEGHIGICPASVEHGDIVVVLLGCDNPLLLRPQDGGEHFQVVGACYIPGIMDAEAMLGTLPSGWAKRLRMSPHGDVIRIYEQGTIKTQLDPRSSPPPDWEVIFGTFENPLEVESEDETEWEQKWFKKSEHGGENLLRPQTDTRAPERTRSRCKILREFVLV